MNKKTEHTKHTTDHWRGENRVKIFSIGRDCLLDILTGRMSLDKDILPDDATIGSLSVDWPSQSIEFIVSSKSYDIVTEGAMPPAENGLRFFVAKNRSEFDYKFITDEGWKAGGGKGVEQGLTYQYSIFKGGDYEIIVSHLNNYVVVLETIEGRTRVNWCGRPLITELVVDASDLLTDIMAEIDRRWKAEQA